MLKLYFKKVKINNLSKILKIKNKDIFFLTNYPFSLQLLYFFLRQGLKLKTLKLIQNFLFNFNVLLEAVYFKLENSLIFFGVRDKLNYDDKIKNMFFFKNFKFVVRYNKVNKKIKKFTKGKVRFSLRLIKVQKTLEYKELLKLWKILLLLFGDLQGNNFLKFNIFNASLKQNIPEEDEIELPDLLQIQFEMVDNYLNKKN